MLNLEYFTVNKNDIMILWYYTITSLLNNNQMTPCVNFQNNRRLKTPQDSLNVCLMNLLWTYKLQFSKFSKDSYISRLSRFLEWCLHYKGESQDVRLLCVYLGIYTVYTWLRNIFILYSIISPIHFNAVLYCRSVVWWARNLLYWAKAEGLDWSVGPR